MQGSHTTLVLAFTTALGLSACGAMRGPSDADIEAIARQQMAAQLENPGLAPDAAQAMEQALASARIDKKGMCNNSKPDVHACMVDVIITMPGTTAPAKQTFVVEITKGTDGKWKGVE